MQRLQYLAECARNYTCENGLGNGLDGCTTTETHDATTTETSATGGGDDCDAQIEAQALLADDADYEDVFGFGSDF